MFSYDDDERDNPAGSPLDDNQLRDWLWRDGPPPVARHLPAYDSDHIGIYPRVEYAGPDTGTTNSNSWTPGGFRQSVPQVPQPSGPAKASRFIDRKTGKFDYWGWLDAGMANLGKGGTLFEDDTPDVMERNAILDKPAAMIAAGAPENRSMPDESRFEAGKERGQSDFLQPVVMKAAEQDTQGNEAPPQNALTAQDATPPPAQDSQPDQRQAEPLPEEYTRLPITEEGWKATPWGEGKKWNDNLPTSSAGAPKVDPHAYEYPKVGEPPDTEEGRRIRALIEKYAKQYGVPAQLLFNKAHAESGGTWNHGQVSSKGARGLFQIMPRTAVALQIDPVDLEQNIHGAAKYTAELLRQTNGDPFLAEIGYNAGGTRIWSNQPLPVETYYHLQKIFPGQRQTYLLQRMPTAITQDPRRLWKEILRY